MSDMRLCDFTAKSLASALGGAAPDNGRAVFSATEINRDTVTVTVRDGTLLATDLYYPPLNVGPTLVSRTPYGRASSSNEALAVALARAGYFIVIQDCRGTGESEPDVWDFAFRECEDGLDVVDWIAQRQWYDGFIGAFGGSYAAMTQWCMAADSRLSAVAPEVCGFRISRSTVRPHMLVNGYSRVVGKGAARLPLDVSEIEEAIEAETLSTGMFNLPLPLLLPDALLERWPQLRDVRPTLAKIELWNLLCGLGAADRTAMLKVLLGVEEITYDDYWRLPGLFDGIALPGVNSIPSRNAVEVCQKIEQPALVVAGWYDWNLNDCLESWSALQAHGKPTGACESRLLICPMAHGGPGYHEGGDDHPELVQSYRNSPPLLLAWFDAVRLQSIECWPKVIYYVLGANEWRSSDAWPPRDAAPMDLYLLADGGLSRDMPFAAPPSRYSYDPLDPTPTVGGSILSFRFPVGSADVQAVQARCDVLTFTTEPLSQDIDIVGPITLTLFASSTAFDTDFVGRLSDVFPDGRAIQLQNGILRARYRDPTKAAPMQPGHPYRFEIDMWATANRFRKGHRIRVDISSADFPRFDRNSNLCGAPGTSIRAEQSIFHDPDHPSQLRLWVAPYNDE